MPSFTLGHFTQPSGSRAAALGIVGALGARAGREGGGGRQEGGDVGCYHQGHSGFGSGRLQACFSPISGDGMLDSG